MIQVYTTTSHSSSRKAIKWLKSHHLEFEEHHIDQLETVDFYKILSLTERGLDDVLSIPGQNYQKFKISHSNFKLTEILKIIKKAPNLLEMPILFNDSYLLVGYNEDELRTFLPSSYRKIERHEVTRLRR
ncbi:ArsC/Spx/MgsR family protein (plasmid) [Lactococcus lactis subsp. lactis]|uniref:Spx/MgsR family RNA polymerase-binding regulatory protein n=1 Tax=Lactococcus cremoris subsp. cremoris IBB477 TaxID=1449093 RepID=A0A1E7G0Y9_LACLC|nr:MULTISPECIES: ArsC/Spx/MgsR family protein [Lactococcus]MCT0051911.1 transcriptional regulator Spx [Lactococcus lactis subsp. lactis]MCT0455259.1 transcriptional regulator Spx [Lactococcus cremoris]MDO6178939.1 ArsC/Spx/MgsR family protein [Lactococcus lactis]MDR7697163.1 ArsC/Spx/MgsR family protein [Lactococcus lactis]MDS1013553.1 ArsC/Spx/MgsR family protein [Lactococcus lactis]